MLPDGKGGFSRRMGMLVYPGALAMRLRSSRLSLAAGNTRPARRVAEPGLHDTPPGVPRQVPDAATMLALLRGA